MFTRGEYSDKTSTYGVLISHNKQETEIVLVVSGEVASAFKRSGGDDYSFLSNKAKNLYNILHTGLAGCASKNGISVEFDLGTSVIHQFTKSKLDYAFELFNGEIVGADIQGDTDSVKLSYCKDGVNLIPQGIPYIKLTKTKAPDFSAELEDNSNDDLDGVQVRTVQEIALEKEDVTWLNNKKYYIVNDDEQAEKLFNYFENYNGVIAYDTETTGLRINCFGKINSDYKRQLEEFNRDNPKEQIRADRLVGIIFCVEPDVSYYFPCFNRKFKNLYDTENETQKKVINSIKVRYTIGEFRDKKSDMADYIRNTPSDEWGCDVILMERVRNILEKHHIVAHNGAFEWKVGYQYEIDTNLKDDTLLLHQILYKFRSTTSNRGEPSNLKYLAKRELNIEQWELYDFFPDFKESVGEVRSKASGKKKKNKKGSKIDFSYMDYAGTRIYAPTDGDVTLQLFMRYKRDMMLNHKEQEYIYNVEVVVACAIAYMEFYGHRIDEDKIAAVRDQTKAKTASIESQIRQYVKYSGQEELEAYDELQKAMEKFTEADNNGTKEEREKANEETLAAVAVLQEAIAKDEEHILNLGSPSQVSELFYNKLEIPFTGEKKSVAKKEIKSLIQAKNEDGSKKYPIVHMYSDYKKMDTLMTKFFDNLPYYMYPGGIVFSSFGQISTATGRMSCSKPNAQQYPKDVTAIVVPRPGFVMADADYSQIEYRVLVAMAGEEQLAKMFSDPDSDYHTLMASMMYGVPYASVTPKMRGDAKSFNFGIPYGMGYGSLAILLTGVNNATTRAEAAEKYELYFKDQPKTRKFFDQVKEMAQVNKYTRTFWSRYRYYSFTDADGNENSGRKAAALRQAGNAIIQGTAADIFKISVARNFMYIRENKLLGLLLIINMIHDEQLFELNMNELNIQRVLRDIGVNMQFKVEGFPPLYIGAGLGSAWAKAKGKMAEIHPLLLDRLSEEAKDMPIRREDTTEVLEKDVLKYFNDRVVDFRREMVREYLINPDNFGKDLHPAIGNLLNLQFSYGHDKEKEGLDDGEFTILCVREFIEHEGLADINAGMFAAQKEALKDIEDEDDYSDDEDDELEDDSDYGETDFALVDESSKVYGSSVQDLIKIFGCFVSKSKRICGINLNVLGYKKKESLIEFLSTHHCEVDAPGAMEIVFLQEAGILNRTGVHVNNIEGSEIERRIKEMSIE